MGYPISTRNSFEAYAKLHLSVAMIFPDVFVFKVLLFPASLSNPEDNREVSLHVFNNVYV